MKVGELAELAVENDDADAIGISGGADRAYWTSPASIMSFTEDGEMTSIPFALLYLQAEHVDQGEVTVKHQGGRQQRFVVTISPYANAALDVARPGFHDFAGPRSW